MTKQLLVAAAALALLSGAAVAQTYESTTSRTTTVAPTIPTPTDSYSSTKTERTYTPSGAAVERQQTYKSDLSGTAATQESKVMRPDGSSETSVRKEWSNSLPIPNPVPPATTTTTTTIQR
ncbi:MAG: hypothetical protein WDO24_13410 [Pseudomonadota bacterium]